MKSGLLRAIGDYTIWLADLSEALKLGTGKTTAKSPTAIAEEFFSAYAISALFLSDESVGILVNTRSQFFYHSSLSLTRDENGELADRALEHLAEAKAELMASARKDLQG